MTEGNESFIFMAPLFQTWLIRENKHEKCLLLFYLFLNLYFLVSMFGDIWAVVLSDEHSVSTLKPSLDAGKVR